MPGSRKSFWLGVAVGSAATVVLLGATAAALIYRAKSEIERRMDARRALHEETGVSPELAPPRLPVEVLSKKPAQAFGNLSYDGSLLDLEGREIPFERFRGQALLVNFFATWCAPCIAELPGLARLEKALSGYRASVVTITDEPLETVRAFLDKRGLDVSIYLAKGPFPRPLDPVGRPEAFLIDCRGEILWRKPGGADWSCPDCVALMRSLAAECSPAAAGS